MRHDSDGAQMGNGWPQVASGDQTVDDGGMGCVGNLWATFHGSSSSIRLIL
jgi:hypothetical protein